MNIFYNKLAFPDVLIITLEDTDKNACHYEKYPDVTIIKNENEEIVGLNIFDITSLNIKDGKGLITLNSEQQNMIQKKLSRYQINIDLNQTDSKFIVGYVKSKEKHDNADKLSVCQVEVDNGEILQIVCGASNVDQGQKVVVAKIGAVMPSGLVIKASKLRGVASFGMLCSAKELQLTSHLDQPGILVLDDTYQVGDIFKI